jgi:hypothetical protein
MGLLSNAWASGSAALGKIGTRIDRGLISGGISAGRRLGLGALEGPPTRNAARLAGLGRGIAGAAGYLAANPVARNAAIGGVVGGAYGTMSDDTNMIGGAFAGAVLGGAGTYGFRALHRGLAARAARQGMASAATIGQTAVSSNQAVGKISTEVSRVAKQRVRDEVARKRMVSQYQRGVEGVDLAGMESRALREDMAKMAQQRGVPAGIGGGNPGWKPERTAGIPGRKRVQSTPLAVRQREASTLANLDREYGTTDHGLGRLRP